ncbi:MAG TPA: hypothetical protein VNX68_05650, partial [Nitrosopumilaceae archaeon]|nr:hypothetical protein [Nitrosopumilaceae archaeon]
MKQHKSFCYILFLLPLFCCAQQTELLLQKGFEKNVNVITFSPDGTYFAAGGDDKLIMLTETKTGITFKTIRTHT